MAKENGNKGVITDKLKLKTLKEMRLEIRERKSLSFQFTKVSREIKGKEHDKENNESGKGENIIDAHDDMINDHKVDNSLNVGEVRCVEKDEIDYRLILKELKKKSGEDDHIDQII